MLHEFRQEFGTRPRESAVCQLTPEEGERFKPGSQSSTFRDPPLGLASPFDGVGGEGGEPQVVISVRVAKRVEGVAQRQAHRAEFVRDYRCRLLELCELFELFWWGERMSRIGSAAQSMRGASEAWVGSVAGALLIALGANTGPCRHPRISTTRRDEHHSSMAQH